MTTLERMARQKAETAMLWELYDCSPIATFVQMYKTANEALGYRAGDQHAPGYRLADRFLQKLRKRGLIKASYVPHWKGYVWGIIDQAAVEAILSEAENGQ